MASPIYGGVTTTPLAMQTIKQKVTDDVANSLKGTKSGEIVTIDDISPLEHNIAVKVEGANHITRSGKNLISYPYVDTTKTHREVTFTDNGDGSIAINGTAAGGSANFILMRNVDFGSVTINAMGKYSATNYTYAVSKHLYYNASGKTLSVNIGDGVEVNETIYPQVELGTVLTEYEQYVEPITYPVNADGSVDGVKSAYPTTVLTADTEGATITAKYNKDINKTLGDLETLLGGI